MYIFARRQDYSYSDFQDFEALSYTWGDLSQKHRITLSGKDFEVTTNLEGALRHLRKTNEPRILWIDAICIDQNNIEEKNVQVPRMSLVYEQAKHVLVWLGEESSDSERAMYLLDRLGGKAEEMEYKDRRQNLGMAPRHLRPKDPTKLMAFEDLTWSDLEVLHNFIRKRPWWTRMWVIQELTYSREAFLICGHRVIHWDTISSLLTRNQEMEKMDVTYFHYFLSIIQPAVSLNIQREHTIPSSYISVFRSLKWNGTRLWKLLETFDDWQCQNPRDKIYVTIDLASCPRSERLRVNYRDPVSKVYTDATWDIIQDVCNGFDSTPSLEVLCSTYRSEFRRDGDRLPSWVPDWSENQEFILMSSKYYAKIPFCAGGTRPLADVPPITDDGILRIKGIQWDTIRHVNDGIGVFNQSNTLSDFNYHVQSWEPDDLEAIKYPTGEDSTDAYWRTLLTDRFFAIKKRRKTLFNSLPNLGTRLTPQDVKNCREEFQVWPGRKKYRQKTARRKELERGIDTTSLLNSFGPVIRGWTMATTEKGYFAMVPLYSRKGDVVCVVPSLGVPLVLRPVATEPLSKAKLELVGPSYVHGIMDGELITRLEQGELEEGMIELV
jgi:hypothetical protein